MRWVGRGTFYRWSLAEGGGRLADPAAGRLQFGHGGVQWGLRTGGWRMIAERQVIVTWADECKMRAWVT